MADKIYLQNGCYISTPSVFPKYWKASKKKKQSKDWRIQYYFYDPKLKNTKDYPKLIVVKGMNSFKSTKARIKVTEGILADEMEALRQGYHPIHKRYMDDHSLDYGVLHPDLPIMVALKLAKNNLNPSESTMLQYDYVIKRMEPVVEKLKMNRIKIRELKRSELKRILENMDLTDKHFNKVKAYLSSFFNELIEYECCETNITRDIRKKKVTVERRNILTPEEYDAVMKHLKTNYYNFWRYSQIFGYSGARTSELMTVKLEDVDIDNQEYIAMIKKGNQHKEKIKVILPFVLPLWKELIAQASHGDYLFSRNLEPGPNRINDDQVGKRWRRLVKKSDSILDGDGEIMKITADFYSLKHRMLDGLPIEIASLLASHTSTRTTAIYQVGKEKRDREKLKNLEVNLMRVV